MKIYLNKLLKNKLVFVYFLFFILHVLFAYKIDSPIIFPDEAAYILNAKQFLFNYGFFPYIHYFYPGYSFFISPLVALSKDVSVVYNGIQYLNAAVFSFVPLLIYSLVGIYKKDFSESQKIWISVVLSFYPSFFVFPALALSENLFIPLFLILGMLVKKLSKDNSGVFSWILAAFLLGFFLILHPMGLSVVFSLLIVIFYLLYLQRSPKLVFAFVFSLIVALVFDCFIFAKMNSLVSNNYLFSPFDISDKNIYSISGLIKFYFNVSNLKSLIVTFCGNFIYLAVATLGFALLGLYYSFAVLKKKDSNFCVTLFFVLSFCFAFAESVLYLSTVRFGLEIIFHGRYLDCFVIPMIVIAVVNFCKNTCEKFYKIFCSIFLVFSLLCLLILKSSLVKSFFVIFMSPGLYTYLPLVKTLGFSGFSLFYLLSFVLIFLFFEKAKKMFSAVILSYFILIILMFNLVEFKSQSLFIDKTMSVLVPITSYLDVSDKASISYDKAGASQFLYSTLKVYLSRVKINTFDSRKLITPKDNLVITSDDKFSDKVPGSVLLWGESLHKQYVWLLPGPEQKLLINNY